MAEYYFDEGFVLGDELRWTNWYVDVLDDLGVKFRQEDTEKLIVLFITNCIQLELRLRHPSWSHLENYIDFIIFCWIWNQFLPIATQKMPHLTL